MLHRIAPAAALILLTSSALAGDLNIVCQNPGAAYNVTFSDGAKEIVINPDGPATRQKVLAATRDMLVLDLGKPGMVSILRTVDPMENAIYADGDLVQTDACS